ncbi:SDR family NAD(P)-dependent oxidoreductase [Desemzia sp. FAM 24101]|uniref:SDR family NAD(P)-dependent oxidoreductase n=1 Tax=Desemzia sp. FAM 24101 TaxID=3259522 RepID=UPI003887B389
MENIYRGGSFVKSDNHLQDKVVFITGASSGLGEQIAYEAALEGAIVVVAARSLDKLQTVRDTCEKISGKKAYLFSMDISKPEEIEAVFQEITATIGPIDVLINNAGFGHFESVLTADMAIAEDMFRVNVLGLMYTSQMAAIHMAERESGHIITIASMAGKMATPKSTIYSATKFAVIGYTNALRLELKPLSIQVSTVNLGPVNTTFFDKADKNGDYLAKVDKYVLDPKEVAHKIVRLIGTNKRELNLPKSMEVASRFYTLFPKMGDYLASTLFNQK